MPLTAVRSDFCPLPTWIGSRRPSHQPRLITLPCVHQETGVASRASNCSSPPLHGRRESPAVPPAAHLSMARARTGSCRLCIKHFVLPATPESGSRRPCHHQPAFADSQNPDSLDVPAAPLPHPRLGVGNRQRPSQKREPPAVLFLRQACPRALITPLICTDPPYVRTSMTVHPLSDLFRLPKTGVVDRALPSGGSRQPCFLAPSSLCQLETRFGAVRAIGRSASGATLYA